MSADEEGALERMAPLVYDLLLYGLAPVAGPVAVALRAGRGKQLAALAERLGWSGEPLATAPGPTTWIHAVSVGEVLAARTLATALRDGVPGAPPVVLSSTTAAGITLARAAVTAGAGGAVAGVIAAPLDFHGALDRAFRRVAPRVLVLVEAELWPNWLRRARRDGVTAALVNARISERSFRRYRALRALFRPLFAGLAAIGARTDVDAERALALGALPDAVRVTGDLKLDAPLPRRSRGEERKELRIPDAPFVLVAGSVLGGEEAAVASAFAALRERVPGAVLVLAPRKALDLSGFGDRPVARRSRGEAAVAGGVLLLDTMGELRDAYAAGDAAFVGGSLVPAGGHNLVEPAAAGLPVLFGPATESFAAVAETLIAAGGGRRAGDAAGLASEVVRLASDPVARRSMGDAARAAVAAGRGATGRTLTLLRDRLGDRLGIPVGRGDETRIP